MRAFFLLRKNNWFFAQFCTRKVFRIVKYVLTPEWYCCLSNKLLSIIILSDSFVILNLLSSLMRMNFALMLMNLLSYFCRTNWKCVKYWANGRANFISLWKRVECSVDGHASTTVDGHDLSRNPLSPLSVSWRSSLTKTVKETQTRLNYRTESNLMADLDFSKRWPQKYLILLFVLSG